MYTKNLSVIYLKSKKHLILLYISYRILESFIYRLKTRLIFGKQLPRILKKFRQVKEVMMKRLMIMMLVLMVVIAVTSCGDKVNATSDGSNTNTENKEEVKAEPEKVEADQEELEESTEVEEPKSSETDQENEELPTNTEGEPEEDPEPEDGYGEITPPPRPKGTVTLNLDSIREVGGSKKAPFRPYNNSLIKGQTEENATTFTMGELLESIGSKEQENDMTVYLIPIYYYGEKVVDPHGVFVIDKASTEAMKKGEDIDVAGVYFVYESNKGELLKYYFETSLYLEHGSGWMANMFNEPLLKNELIQIGKSEIRSFYLYEK